MILSQKSSQIHEQHHKKTKGWARMVHEFVFHSKIILTFDKVLYFIINDTPFLLHAMRMQQIINTQNVT